MKEKKNVDVSFGLNSFEIESYEFKKPKKKLNVNKLGYQIQFRPDIDVDNDTFIIEMKVQAKFGKESDEAVGSIHTKTNYRVILLKDLVKEGKLELPKNLAVTLLSIALSTTRGALAAKSEGNILAENVMPLINPEEMYESSPLKGAIELD
ncbi:MAG: hypothetical protein JJU37_15825 [Balneolaceae bacterium]|nr:hypothetical protein [Balneolaceae bacterium]